MRIADPLRPEAIEEPQPRPARRARDRLGMEATVGRVGVLARARGAHRESRHGGERAVVRNAADDGEARAAVRAVDEGIAVAAVGGIEQLAQAVVAGRDVGGHGHAARTPPDRLATIAKPERPRAAIELTRTRVECGEGRRVALQTREEARHVGFGAFDLDQDAARVVGDEAGQTEARRQCVHEGPEADALHDSFETHPAADAKDLVRDGGPGLRLQHGRGLSAGRSAAWRHHVGERNDLVA